MNTYIAILSEVYAKRKMLAQQDFNSSRLDVITGDFWRFQLEEWWHRRKHKKQGFKKIQRCLWCTVPKDTSDASPMAADTDQDPRETEQSSEPPVALPAQCAPMVGLSEEERKLVRETFQAVTSMSRQPKAETSPAALWTMESRLEAMQQQQGALMKAVQQLQAAMETFQHQRTALPTHQQAALPPLVVAKAKSAQPLVSYASRQRPSESPPSIAPGAKSNEQTAAEDGRNCTQATPHLATNGRAPSLAEHAAVCANSHVGSTADNQSGRPPIAESSEPVRETKAMEGNRDVAATVTIQGGQPPIAESSEPVRETKAVEGDHDVAANVTMEAGQAVIAEHSEPVHETTKIEGDRPAAASVPMQAAVDGTPETEVPGTVKVTTTIPPTAPSQE
jgi:hypothetical protein